MVRDSPGAGRALSPATTTRAPLLVTADLPADLFAWVDALRRKHYPPERNRLGAHVTLFHGLPPSANDAVRAALARMAARPAPEARFTGIMDLGRGTAFAVDSPVMVAIHGEMAEAFHGLIQQKDGQPLRLHVTVQNKVAVAEARALQAELECAVPRQGFRFRGLLLSEWRDELWRPAQAYPFRGRA